MARAKKEREQRDSELAGQGFQKFQEWQNFGGLANQQFQNENLYKPTITTVTNATPSTSYMASAVLNK